MSECRRLRPEDFEVGILDEIFCEQDLVQFLLVGLDPLVEAKGAVVEVKFPVRLKLMILPDLLDDEALVRRVLA